MGYKSCPTKYIFGNIYNECITPKKTFNQNNTDIAVQKKAEGEERL